MTEKPFVNLVINAIFFVFRMLDYDGDAAASFNDIAISIARSNAINYWNSVLLLEKGVGDVWYPPQQQNNSQPNSQQYPPVIDLQEKQKEIQQDIQLQNQQIQQMQQKQQMEHPSLL